MVNDNNDDKVASHFFEIEDIVHEFYETHELSELVTDEYIITMLMNILKISRVIATTSVNNWNTWL